MSLKTFAIAACPSPFRQFLASALASPLGSRLARGTIWSVLGAGISRLLALSSSIAIARILGKENYGEFGLLQSTLTMIQVFAGFGIGLTATRYVAEFRYKDPARAGRIVALLGIVSIASATVGAVIMIFFAPFICDHFFHAPNMKGLLRVGAIVVFVGAINVVQIGVLAGLEAFKCIAWINLISGTLTLPIMITGVYVTGLEGAIAGLAVSSFLSLILSSWFLRRRARHVGLLISLKGCLLEWPLLIRFLLPLVLCGLVHEPAVWLGNVMLARQANGYSEMGILTAANQWTSAILFIPMTLMQVCLPVLAHLQGEGAWRKYIKLLTYSTILSAVLALVPAAATALLSSRIMSVYGQGFPSGGPVLLLISLTSIILACDNVLINSIMSLGWMWWAFVTGILWSIVFLVVAMWAHRFGAIGISASNLAAYCIHLVVMFCLTLIALRKRVGPSITVN